MVRWRRTAASLLAIVALAGSPALWSACVALCMPERPGHVTASQAAPAEAACSEHEAATPGDPGAAMTASHAACCAERFTSASPATAAERTDTRVAPAPVLAPLAMWTSAPPSPAAPRVAHDRGSPPRPVRHHSVLRI